MLKQITAVAILVPAIMVGGCASNISSNSYETAQVGEATRTYEGTVVDKRVVEVKGNTAAQVGGAVAGAVAGGALGSLAGSGSGKTAMTIGGAALGGVAGNEAGKAISKQSAIEYTVRLDDGSLRTIVQGVEPQLSVNQRVFVQVSNGGRSRVVANNSGY